MNSVKKLIAALLCAIAAVFVLGACSDKGAPEHSTKEPQFAVEASALRAELKGFMTGREDRTSFTEKERSAAAYLNEKLLSYGITDVSVREFTTTENGVSDLQSQNVVARIPAASGAENVKNVVLGAYYDNRYGSAYKGSLGDKSAAVLFGGTSVATLLAIADYLQNTAEPLGFDVNIVFFGASYLHADGAEAYLDSMTGEEIGDIALMAELQRLGCDHVYAFSDARRTKREELFSEIAADNALDVYKVTPKTPLITEYSALKGVPYYQWAHSGLFATFFNANIPTLNIMGANWENIDMRDRESSKYDNISLTSRDTLDTLEKLYPDYGEKMATAATLVIRSLEDPDFLSTVTYDREHFPDTSVLTKQWLWYLIVFGVMAVALLILFLVTSHLGKKYKPAPQKTARVKMAVFGMDYEDKDSADVFIDTTDSLGSRQIFPGVPNNSETPTQRPTVGTVVKPDIDPFDNSDGMGGNIDPFDNSGNSGGNIDPFDNSGEAGSGGDDKSDENGEGR